MAMWLLRLHTFAKGRSGIGLDTIGAVLKLLNAGVLGLVPSRGSVGASGDLAAAAHASLVLLGEGKCSRPGHNRSEFEIVDSSRALAELGLRPLSFRPKEGLSLINGGHFTAALATKAWYEAGKLLRTANLAAAMNMEAMGGAGAALEESILATHHPHTGLVGREMAHWLEGSQFLHGAREDNRFFQAPYCLRCAPQVHGAVAAELDGVENTLRDDYEAISDNPLVFAETEEIHSCGNFHAIYAARASDKLASAITTLGSISERMINMAMDERLSGLPGFLIHNGGFNSGLMMVQVTAAALVSECKSLCFPASVDSIPTNCDREDHVSMGPIAGHKALAVVEHVRNILAIELLVAAQALDLRGARVQMPPAIRRVHSRLREHVDFVERDRVLSPDIESINRLIGQQALF
jgi:histidine ammonia-lyase